MGHYLCQHCGSTKGSYTGQCQVCAKFPIINQETTNINITIEESKMCDNCSHAKSCLVIKDVCICWHCLDKAWQIHYQSHKTMDEIVQESGM